MFVAQVGPERTGARQAAWRLWPFQFDVERRHIAPALRSGDRGGIAHEPEIAPGFIVWRKNAALLRPAHDTDEVDRAGHLPFGAASRVLPALRAEAPGG